MIIYSVTVSIERSRASEWLTWMEEEHLPEVMATAYFQSYRLHRLIDPIYEPDTVTYNVQYEVESLSELDAYRRLAAPALQAKHQERYGEQSLAVRSVLERISEKGV